MSPSIMSAENSVVPVSTPDDDSSAFDRLRSAAVDLGVPAGAYRIGAAADGAWCLFRDGLKWTVFLSDRGERRQVAGFDTSHQAIAYLVGQLYLSHKLAGGTATSFDAGVMQREIAGKPVSGVGAADALTADADVPAALAEPPSASNYAARSHTAGRDQSARPEPKSRQVVEPRGGEPKESASAPSKPSIPSGGVASLAAGLAAARAARLPLPDDAKATRPRPGDVTAKPARDEPPAGREHSDAANRDNRTREESGLIKAGPARPDSNARPALPGSQARPLGSQPNAPTPRPPQPSPGERSTVEQRVTPQPAQAGHSPGARPGPVGERPASSERPVSGEASMSGESSTSGERPGPGNPAGGRRRNVPGTRSGVPAAATGAVDTAGGSPTVPGAQSTDTSTVARALNPGAPATPGATRTPSATPKSQPLITPRTNATVGAPATPHGTGRPGPGATAASGIPNTPGTAGTPKPGTTAAPNASGAVTPSGGGALGTADGAGAVNAAAASASGVRSPAHQGTPPQWKIKPLHGEPPLTLYRDKRMVTLPAGTEVDRYGEPDGNVTYAARTQYQHRSLPTDWSNQSYHVYRLQRPIEALAGVAVPWFDQPGGGTAFVLPAAIKDLLSDGSLVEVG